ncbi:MAG: outer membrane protein assembly factor BamA [Bacteroidetes bacterium]|nr:outer membrane protein assembly factor BamA [Bacteroidota bacterium]
MPDRLFRYTVLTFGCLTLLLTRSNVAAQSPDTSFLPIINYSVSIDYEIGGITVSGTEYVDKSRVLARSGLVVGQEITLPGDDIAEAIKKLWRSDLFSEIEFTITNLIGTRIFLNIHLKERPRLSFFKFRGISKGDADELKDRIGIRKGDPITKNLKISTVNIVTRYYKNKGFLNVTVNLFEKIDTSQQNYMALIIDIKKGNKVKIYSIDFTGNHHVKSSKLRSLMKDTKEQARLNIFSNKTSKSGTGDTTKTQYIYWNNLSFKGLLKGMYDYGSENFKIGIFNSSKFLKKDFKDDKAKIIAYYNTKGFRDAKIMGDTIYSYDKTHLSIVVHIDEGGRYYFRNIDWSGNAKYSTDTLNQILNIKRGEIFDQGLLETQLYSNPLGNDITSLYMDDGYLFFQLTPVEVAVEGDSIDILIKVYEGPQAIIGKVTIVGNTKTKEHVIRRELRTLPGNVFSRADIIRSQREIANLGFFNPETLGVIPTPHPEDGTVDIEYSVEERPSDQIELSAGYGANRLVGTLGVSFNNFSMGSVFDKDAWSPMPSGDGQRFSVRAQSQGEFYQALTASFTEPWLGGKKPNSFSVAAYTSKRANGFYNSDRKFEETESIVTTGGTIGLGTRLKWPDDYFILQSVIELQRFDLDNFSAFLFKNGIANNINITEILSRNSVDQPIYPRKGSKFALTMKLTLPYSLISKRRFFTQQDWDGLDSEEKYKFLEYHKWKFDAEWYTSIIGNLVLKARASMGFLGQYNTKLGYSPFERFKLGGDGLSTFFLYGEEIISLRGYEPEEINFRQQFEGATIFNKFTLELRYPLSLNPASTIYGLAFVEGGNIWYDAKDFDPFEIKRSVGLGLRVHLPMFGLLGVDYGIGFDKDLSLFQRGTFSLMLGFEPY